MLSLPVILFASLASAAVYAPPLSGYNGTFTILPVMPTGTGIIPSGTVGLPIETLVTATVTYTTCYTTITTSVCPNQPGHCSYTKTMTATCIGSPCGSSTMTPPIPVETPHCPGGGYCHHSKPPGHCTTPGCPPPPGHCTTPGCPPTPPSTLTTAPPMMTSSPPQEGHCNGEPCKPKPTPCNGEGCPPVKPTPCNGEGCPPGKPTVTPPACNGNGCPPGKPTVSPPPMACPNGNCTTNNIPPLETFTGAASGVFVAGHGVVAAVVAGLIAFAL
ncbi:hypothetical protein BZA77DRAFT_314682 [Pyronema omphalodes]|nr:hypothetical protein BZA77DRAFT_314682 [Pyronema omphalodes]